MVGAIRDGAGRVLVTKRPDHVHQGGLWEFPGGKLEPGEPPAQGLGRELAEELGIEVRRSRPLIRVGHDYGDRHVVLDVHLILEYRGTPEGREGQPLDWRHPDAMDPADFPAADRPIIRALQLPERMLVTGTDPLQPERFIGRLDHALGNGIRLVQLRAHALDDDAYRRLAEPVFDRCERHGARLLLNRDPARVGSLPRHGLHLTATALSRCQTRPGAAGELIGASCHDAAQLQRAHALGLDYALLSPVRPTATHPAASPLGWSGFAALVEHATLPIYALGGLVATDLEQAIAHGAQGIAAIRAFWPEDST